MNFNYDLKEEEQLFLDGMKAGIKITLDCLKERMPEFFDNIQLSIDMMLDLKNERIMEFNEYRNN